MKAIQNQLSAIRSKIIRKLLLVAKMAIIILGTNSQII